MTMDLKTMSLSDLYDLTCDLEADLEAGAGSDVVPLLEAIEAEIQRRWGVELGECA